MLIEFRVENFRSLRDEQVITFESGSSRDEADERPRQVEGFGKTILPAAVVYGANASGKSSVLFALDFMAKSVSFSHWLWDPEGGISRTPFAWGGKSKDPSLFEIMFVQEGVKYTYGFTLDDEQVCEEWLHTWPKNRKRVLFERDQKRFVFGDSLSGPNESVREVTRTNALFLSAAAQHRHPQLSPVYSWFRRVIGANASNRELSLLPFQVHPRQLLLFKDDDVKGDINFSQRIRNLLSVADIGIVDIKSVQSETEGIKQARRRKKILLKHQADDDDSWLPLESESGGTKTLFGLAPDLFKVLESGGILLVDELESSLHPLVGQAIVQMFNCPSANPNNAQILFTTHDTNLLGTTLGEPALRRDQVWLVEKDEAGASNLYPLTDYKPRTQENLERGYLQGRYGAIPFLGDISKIME